MQNTFSQSGNDSKWFFKKIIFQNRHVALETHPPSFMVNAILNFHFDYLNPSLIYHPWPFWYHTYHGNKLDCHEQKRQTIKRIQLSCSQKDIELLKTKVKNRTRLQLQENAPPAIIPACVIQIVYVRRKKGAHGHPYWTNITRHILHQSFIFLFFKS